MDSLKQGVLEEEKTEERVNSISVFSLFMMVIDSSEQSTHKKLALGI
jgi:hypothetical protein